MKLLVLGAGGMLGFALHRILHDTGWSIVGCVRSDSAPADPWCVGLAYETGVDARNFESLRRTIERSACDVVINAIGITSPTAAGGSAAEMLAVNAVLPRRLDVLAAASGFRLVHFSTDGVFSGRAGHYDESALPDADDDYGVSKFLGEPGGSHALVLRTSLIGRSLRGGRSLLDWLLQQQGQIAGFTQVMFSGLTVDEIASVLDRTLRRDALPHGLYHLSGDPISKFDLIRKLAAAWGRHDLDIRPADYPVCDRSLDSRRLRHLISYEPPDWDTMIAKTRDFYAGIPQRSRQA